MLKASEKSFISSLVFALTVKAREEAAILMNVLHASFSWKAPRARS